MKPPTFDGPLCRGDSGPRVVLLQQLLCLDGLSVKQDGDFGPCTEAAVRHYQGQLRLPVTGAVNATTFASLTILMSGLTTPLVGDYASKLASLLEHALLSDIREFPQNRGPWVKMLCGEDGIPWCAGFALSMVRFAGADIPLMLGCHSIADWAEKRGRLSDTPTAGGLFLIPHANGVGYEHVGVVVEDCGGVIRTAEGNSNDDGSANGTRVVQRFRPSKGLKYVRLP